MTTTNDQEALDATARAVQTVQHGVGRAIPLLQRIIDGITSPVSPEANVLVGHLVEASRAASTAQELLVRGLGAQSPGLRVARDSLRLDQLDTSASRRLLRALVEAVLAAYDLDEERGWVDEDGHATGWAETLGGLEMGLRREVEGAKGGGRE